MGFTTESARFMLRSRGGKAYARNHRDRGFPTLVKARAMLALKRDRLRAEQLALDSTAHCKCCSLRKLLIDNQ